MKLNATVISPKQLELNAIRFAWSRDGEDSRASVVDVEGIHDVLGEMSIDLRARVAERLFVQQDLRVYDDQAFWVIKPSQARLWSETAALNDADTVLREHMEWVSHV